MYKIFLRGQDDVEVDDIIGQKLSEQWESNSLPDKFKINADNWIESKSIKGIKRVASLSREQEKIANSEKMQDIKNLHLKQMMLWVTKSKDERAAYLQLAQFVWFAHTGTHTIPDEIKPKVIATQKQYLEEHPTYVFANPICIKSIAQANMVSPTAKGNESFSPIEGIMRENAMNIALSCYQETLSYTPQDATM